MCIPSHGPSLLVHCPQLSLISSLLSQPGIFLPEETFARGVHGLLSLYPFYFKTWVVVLSWPMILRSERSEVPLVWTD